MIGAIPSKPVEMCPRGRRGREVGGLGGLVAAGTPRSLSVHTDILFAQQHGRGSRGPHALQVACRWRRETCALKQWPVAVARDPESRVFAGGE